MKRFVLILFVSSLISKAPALAQQTDSNVIAVDVAGNMVVADWTIVGARSAACIITGSTRTPT
jgi:hypothetical protein